MFSVKIKNNSCHDTKNVKDMTMQRQHIPLTLPTCNKIGVPCQWCNFFSENCMKCSEMKKNPTDTTLLTLWG